MILMLLHLTPSFLIPIASYYGVKYQYLSITPPVENSNVDDVSLKDNLTIPSVPTITAPLEQGEGCEKEESSPPPSSSSSTTITTSTSKSNEVPQNLSQQDVEAVNTAEQGTNVPKVKTKVIKRVVKKATGQNTNTTTPTATLDDLANAFGF